MIGSKDDLSLNGLLEKGYELVTLFGLFSLLKSGKKIKEKQEKGFYRITCSDEELKKTIDDFFSDSSAPKIDIFREGAARFKVRILNAGLNGFDLNLSSSESLENAFDYAINSGAVDLTPFAVFRTAGKINPDYSTFLLCTEGGEVPLSFNTPFSEYKEISDLYYAKKDVVIRAALFFSLTNP